MNTADIRHIWAGHTVVEALCDEVDRLRAERDTADMRDGDALLQEAEYQALQSDYRVMEERAAQADARFAQLGAAITPLLPHAEWLTFYERTLREDRADGFEPWAIEGWKHWLAVRDALTMTATQETDMTNNERIIITNLAAVVQALAALCAADNCNYQRDTMRAAGLFDAGRAALLAVGVDRSRGENNPEFVEQKHAE